jgi:capsular exopolysaccharide synthesis family protein
LGNRPDPGLADHVRSIWRRKPLVITALAVGLLLGMFVLPKVASATRYRATVRIDVQPMHSAVLSQSVGNSASRTSKGTGLETTSALQDVNVAKGVLQSLGPTASRLSAVKHVQPAEWPGALARSIVPTEVPGSTQWDLAYTDRDSQVASVVVQRYATAFVQARNTHDKQLVDRGQQDLRNRIKQLQANINAWAAKAQAEANASLHNTPTIATAGQLQALRNDLATTNQALHNAQDQLLFLDPSTSVLTPPVVAPANQPIALAIYLSIGLLIGLVGGAGVALVLEAISPKVVTLEDVAQATKLAPVGSVPSIGVFPTGPRAIVDRPFSPAAEGYRKVAAELERRGLGDDVMVLAIVSAERGEGKSTLTVNLAHALAGDDRTVVVVSGDLRKPDVERIFGVERKKGLAELLQSGDQGDPAGLLQKVGDHLLVLPAGVPERNPAELLATAKLPKVVESLRGSGRLILIDTPPARSLADALCLANCADGVLLVARSGTTRAHSLEEVSAGLQRVDRWTLDVVLVDASRGAMSRRDLLRAAYDRYVDNFPSTPEPKPLPNSSRNPNGNAPAPKSGQLLSRLDQEAPYWSHRHQPQPRRGPADRS